MNLVLLFFVVIVKYKDWSPDVFFVLIYWGQGMRLVRSSLAEVNPLFNSFIFFPSVVTSESLDAWKIRATVKYLVLLLEYL